MKVKIYSKAAIFNNSKTVQTVFPPQAGYEFGTNIANLDGIYLDSVRVTKLF